MTCIDHSLIYNASKFITGANAHLVGTWIFCYRTTPQSQLRDRFEKLLREFVAANNLLLASRIHVNAVRRDCEIPDAAYYLES